MSPHLRRSVPAIAAAAGAGAALLAAPAGIVVLGMVTGSLNALLAIGLVLVYRSNRIVNFAHGELGGTAAVLTVLLVYRGWNYFAAVVLGLAGAALLGALVEVLIIRRFRDAPRLLLTVATIGLAQLLAFAALVLPSLFDKAIVPQDFSTPLSTWRFEMYPVVFNGNHVLVIAFVVAAAAGLTFFLNRSSYGVAILASAENADRAALCGVPIKALSTLVWVIAAFLSAAAAILQAPIVGLPVGNLVGPGLLLRGLAAAVIGRMQSLPLTIAAALGLGVFEQVVFFRVGRSPVVDAVLLVVILAGLLTQRRILSRVDPADTSSWRAVAEVRPIPRELRALPEIRWARRALPAVLLAAAILVPQLLLSESRLILATAIVIWALVGLSLVVLTGWAGQISLGQFAIVGIGAAVGGTLASEGHADFIVATVGAAASGMLAALALGLPALRLRGFFLAVTTLSFAVATSSYLLTLDWLAPDGVVERPVLLGRFDLEDELAYYYVCLAILVGAIAVVGRLRRSAVGRAIVAVRDNERAAQSYGASAVAAKLTAFMISGALAGVAGSLMVHHQHRLQLTQYDPGDSLAAFTMAVIGGLGSIPGAVLGALYVRGIQDFAPGDWTIFASGAGLLVLLLVLPGGLGSLVYRLRDILLRRIALRRGITVASLVEDRRVELRAAPVDIAAEAPALAAAAGIAAP